MPAVHHLQAIPPRTYPEVHNFQSEMFYPPTLLPPRHPMITQQPIPFIPASSFPDLYRLQPEEYALMSAPTSAQQRENQIRAHVAPATTAAAAETATPVAVEVPVGNSTSINSPIRTAEVMSVVDAANGDDSDDDISNMENEVLSEYVNVIV